MRNIALFYFLDHQIHPIFNQNLVFSQPDVFSKENDYYRFGVVVGFTTNKGYLYIEKDKIYVGDTLPATSVRNKDYHFKVVLTKQLDNKWFEYYEIK